MAKNWSMKDAANEVLAGNKEAIVDIGRRFPLTLNAISLMGKNEGGMLILNALPEHITARKIESVLKDGVQDIEETEGEIEEVATEETTTEKPAKKEKPVKREKKAKKEEVEDEDFMNEIPEEVDDELNLKAMSAVELFKLAKKKGLKPAPKQTKDYYLELLNPTDDSDDWDDEDEEEEKPVKKEKKAKKEEKPAKKEKKPAKKDDDEDDDWDI